MHGAVILAAGASSRMGHPKALLRFGDLTALDLALGSARAVADEVVVVLGHHADRIRAAVDLDGVRVVVNPDPAAGRTGSLQRGLAALPDVDALFIHPVDVPLAKPADFLALADAHATRAAGVGFLVPTYAGRGGHPLLVDRAHRDDLLVLAPDAPLRDALDARPDAVARVPVANPGILVNVNTPADYARALDLYGSGRALHAAQPPP